MTKDLVHDAELWLPSEFIYDDLFLEAEQGMKEEAVANPEIPVVENDEDYMAGLTQRMAHSFLVDDEESSWSFVAADNAKVGDMAGSPQSTLWDWPSSKKGSPEEDSLVSSPPFSPGEEDEQQKQKQKKGDPWALLSEAAGQVMRLRMNDLDHIRDLNQEGLPGAEGNISAALPVPCKKAGTGYYGSSPTLQQLRAAQFYRLKQLQMIKQQQQQRKKQSTPWGNHDKPRGDGIGGHGEVRGGQPLGLSPSAWPPLCKRQQQSPKSGSGEAMRDVFKGSGTRKESVGTGVFIPRHADNIIDPPRNKQPACSTFLVPARVVQVLNLNLEQLGAQPRFPGAYALDQAALVGRSMSHQKRNSSATQSTTIAAAAAAAHELRLPQEWTY